MKKFLTLGLLLSSLVFVGCKNVLNTWDMSKMLELAHNSGNGFTVCTGEYCRKKGIDLKRFSIVHEEADGDGHVVIKYYSEGYYGIGAGWKYVGVSLEGFSYGDWKNQDLGDKLDDLVEIIEDGIYNYGYLVFEPEDDDFFYKNRKTGAYELFSETSQAGKDLELMGARVEESNANQLGERLAAQYGLSEERGQEVAKTMAVYNKLITKRALTASEKNQFSNSLLGVDYNAAERAVMSGDADDFDALMERAAEVNGTSPEAMTAIIKDMVL